MDPKKRVLTSNMTSGHFGSHWWPPLGGCSLNPRVFGVDISEFLLVVGWVCLEVYLARKRSTREEHVWSTQIAYFSPWVYRAGRWPKIAGDVLKLAFDPILPTDFNGIYHENGEVPWLCSITGGWANVILGRKYICGIRCWGRLESPFTLKVKYNFRKSNKHTGTPPNATVVGETRPKIHGLWITTILRTVVPFTFFQAS